MSRAVRVREESGFVEEKGAAGRLRFAQQHRTATASPVTIEREGERAAWEGEKRGLEARLREEEAEVEAGDKVRRGMGGSCRRTWGRKGGGACFLAAGLPRWNDEGRRR